MNDVRRFSQSELRDFQRCKRKWWLRHVRRLAPKLTGPVGALQSGSRVHAALEAYYTPDCEDDLRSVLETELKNANAGYLERCEALEVPPDRDVLKKFSKDAELERAMIEGYTQWLAETGADAHLQIIDVERQVSVTDKQIGAELIRPFDVVGKLDARAFDEVTGCRKFIDHKTAQNFTQLLPGLRGDTQMLHYHLLEFYGELDGADNDTRCDGAIYNMLRKVKRTGTAKPPFYMREDIPHNDEEIEAYRLRLIGLIINVFELESRLEQMPETGPIMFAQPNRTKDCQWDCDFVQICTMFDDGSRVEDAIRNLFTERDPMERYGSDSGEKDPV